MRNVEIIVKDRETIRVSAPTWRPRAPNQCTVQVRKKKIKIAATIHRRSAANHRCSAEAKEPDGIAELYLGLAGKEGLNIGVLILC
jgi:hypothetical protein